MGGCADHHCTLEEAQLSSSTILCVRPTSVVGMVERTRELGGIAFIGAATEEPYEPDSPLVLGPEPFSAEQVVRGEIRVLDNLGEVVGDTVAVRAWTGIQYASRVDGGPSCTRAGLPIARRCFDPDHEGLSPLSEERLFILRPAEHPPLLLEAYNVVVPPPGGFRDAFALEYQTEIDDLRRVIVDPTEGWVPVEDLRRH
jgi:hypothetical protein